MSSPVQGNPGSTAPATPTAAGETFLYGFGGGGDSPARLEAAFNKRTLTSPYHRRGTPTPTLSNTGGTLLGSPVRLSGPSRIRPLVRARQPLIPLADYATPTRSKSTTVHTWPDSIPIVDSSITLDELLFGPSSGSPRASLLSSEDDFTQTVALATVAAISETFQEEGIATDVKEPGAASDPTASTSGVKEQVPAMDAEPTVAAPDSAAQLTQAKYVADGHHYVLPSPPLAPLAHTDTVPFNAGGLGSTTDYTHLYAPPRKIEPVTPSFLECCHIPKFNPRRPTYTNFDLVMRLPNQWGWTLGLTKTELKQILKQCSLCGRYMFADRRSLHRCDGTNLDISSPQFDLVQVLLGFVEHSGFSVADLANLLYRCNDCNRILHVTPGSLTTTSDSSTAHHCSSENDFW